MRRRRLTFSAYDLGERALAWIVEERELRAALLRTTLAAGVDVHGGGAVRRIDVRRRRARR